MKAVGSRGRHSVVGVARGYKQTPCPGKAQESLPVGMSRLTPVDEVPRVEELDCGSRLSFGMCKDRSGWGVDANAVVSWRSLRGVRALAKVHAAQKLALPAELHISSSIITHFSPKVLLHISLYHHLGSYSGALRQTVASSAQETRAFIGSSSVEFAAFGTEILRSGTEAIGGWLRACALLYPLPHTTLPRCNPPSHPP